MNDEPVEYQGPIVVDARVAIAGGGVHSYVGIEPIDKDLDSDTDGLILYREGKMIVGYYPRFWRAVETFNPRPLWLWQDEQRRTREEVSPPSPEDMTKIRVIHERCNNMQQELTALRVGFSELRQHLGPLLSCLRKEEYYTIPDFRER